MILNRKQIEPSRFLQTRKKILLSLYGVGVLAALTIVLTLVYQISPDNLFAMVLTSLAMTVIGVGLGAFVSVILDLPNISKEFDVIKNRVASQELTNVEEFSLEAMTMICEFFSFTFLNIRSAYMKVDGHSYVYTSDDIFSVLNLDELNDLSETCRHSESASYVGPIKINGHKVHHYVIPVVFGSKHLGFFGVITENKLLGLFIEILSSFEDDHLDDQLIHVIEYERRKLLRDSLLEIDVFSDKISRGEYDRVDSYQYDIVSYLVKKVDCIGGVFLSTYSASAAVYVKDGAVLPDLADHFTKYIKLNGTVSSPRIFSDPNLNRQNFILELPVIIEKLSGVIYLVDSVDELLRVHADSLAEIENIKLDNDLENLASKLGLNRRINQCFG